MNDRAYIVRTRPAQSGWRASVQDMTRPAHVPVSAVAGTEVAAILAAFTRARLPIIPTSEES